MTTSNPNWKRARDPSGLIPDLPKSEKAKDMLMLVGLFMLTQGERSGERFSDAMLPWQRKFIECMFADGVREVGLKCGKGSGKTVLLSAIALALVMYYTREGKHNRASIILLAANVDSAGIAWRHILEAIDADPHLKDQFHLHQAKRELTHKESKIQIKVTPPTLSAAAGRRVVGLLVDEVHVAALENRDFTTVVDQLRRGAGNFGDDFLHLSITTAPPARADGYYTQWLARMRAVRDGKVTDDSILPVLFEMPHDDPRIDPENPDEWWRGMPSLRTQSQPLGTMDIKQLQRELDEAVRDAEITGGDSLQMMLSQRLGIEPDDRKGGGTTPLAEYWPKAAIDVVHLSSGEITTAVGIDPSPGLSDPFAVIRVVKSKDMYYVDSRQFLTQDAFDKAPERIMLVYQAAINVGELRLHDTSDEVQRQALAYISKQGNGLADLRGGDAAGLTGFKERFEATCGEYVAVEQGWKLIGSFETTQALVQSGRMKHLNRPLLNENVRNIQLKNNRFDKRDASSGGIGWSKIDGAMALFSAVHLLETQPRFDVAAMIGG